MPSRPVPWGQRLRIGRRPAAPYLRTRHQRLVADVLERMRWARATDLAQLVMLNELERNYPKGAVYDVRIPAHQLKTPGTVVQQ